MSLTAGLAPAREQSEAEPLQAHWRLDGRALRALAVVLGAIVLLAGWSWWNGRPLPQESVIVGASSSAGPAITGGGGQAGSVIVDVRGEVAQPGLVTLPAGSRVADAIEKAGGATGSTDGVNLARVLVDGEQVVVGAKATGAGDDGRVSLNTADAAALDALPGIGPVLAQRIVDWREAQGPFASVDALGDVPGIGPSLLGRLTPLVTT